MNENFIPAISEETFAAWLDGNVTPEQDNVISQMCAADQHLQDILDASDDVDLEYESLIEDGYPLPEEFENDFELPYVEIAADEDENAVTMDDEILPYENDEEVEEYEGEHGDNQIHDDDYIPYPIDDDVEHDISTSDDDAVEQDVPTDDIVAF